MFSNYTKFLFINNIFAFFLYFFLSFFLFFIFFLSFPSLPWPRLVASTGDWPQARANEDIVALTTALAATLAIATQATNLVGDVEVGLPLANLAIT